MLELLITYLRLTMGNSFPNVEEVYGLADIIQEPSQSYPKVYCTNGDYKDVGDLENYIYFRQLGPASETDSEEEAVSGCDHYVVRTYPMIAVGYIPKNVFNTDNAFIDSKVANNIANIIRLADYGTLMASAGADDIYVDIRSIETNRHSVWNREFRGIDMAARLDHVYCSVEFDIVVSASESCLRNYDCDDQQIVINGDTIEIITRCGCPPPIIFTKTGVTDSMQDDRLIGGNIDNLFLFQAGTELVSAQVVSDYDTLTGTVTFTADLGGSDVRVQLFQ